MNGSVPYPFWEFHTSNAERREAPLQWQWANRGTVSSTIAADFETTAARLRKRANQGRSRV